jgi:hypothetical protein
MSIFLIGQDTRCIPSVLRKNTTHLFAFKTSNEAEIKNLWLDTGCVCAFEVFKSYFQSVTAIKYGYLFVDTMTGTISDTF